MANKSKSKQRGNNLVQPSATNAKLKASEQEYGQAIKMFKVAEKENAYSGYSRKLKTI